MYKVYRNDDTGRLYPGRGSVTRVKASRPRTLRYTDENTLILYLL